MATQPRSKGDIVYFNASVKNTSDTEISLLEFDQTRSQNILNKMSDYYMAIISFDIPNSALPIFIFEPNIYSITIENGGVPYRRFLTYISYGDPYSQISGNSRGIYYFQQMVDMINTALQQAHTASGATGNVPVMLLRSDGRFELRQDQAYSGDVYFSTELFRLFLGMESIFYGYNEPDGKDQLMLNKDNYNNTGSYNPPLTGTYNLNVQENKSQYLWPYIKYLVLLSKSMSVNREYIGFDNDNQNTRLNAITDFTPIYDTGAGIDRTDWTYTSGSGYRLIELNSDDALRRVDFSVVGIDRTGKQVNIFLPPQATANVKFMFVRKSLENNAYTSLGFDWKTATMNL